MKNRNEILDIYLQQFASYKSVQLLINPSFVLKDSNILESLEQTRERFIQIIPEIELQENEKIELISKSKSLYSVVNCERRIADGTLLIN